MPGTVPHSWDTPVNMLTQASSLHPFIPSTSIYFSQWVLSPYCVPVTHCSWATQTPQSTSDSDTHPSSLHPFISFNSDSHNFLLSTCYVPAAVLVLWKHRQLVFSSGDTCWTLNSVPGTGLRCRNTPVTAEHRCSSFTHSCL